MGGAGSQERLGFRMITMALGEPGKAPGLAPIVRAKVLLMPWGLVPLKQDRHLAGTVRGTRRLRAQLGWLEQMSILEVVAVKNNHRRRNGGVGFQSRVERASMAGLMAARA